MSVSRSPDTFQIIIDFNYVSSPTEIIRVAADDPRLREVTRWLLEDPAAPDPEDGYDYEEVAGHITEKYGLEVEEAGLVMNMCAERIYEELQSV